MTSLIDVALPVGVDKAFTYRVPEELKDDAVPGVRVLVPFGPKHAVGLVLGPAAGAPPPGLKSIREVLDSGPILSPELMELCRWIGSYYVTPIGEVLKAALPHAFRRPGTRMAHLVTVPDPEALERLRRRAPAQARVLELLAKQSPRPLGEIIRLSRMRTPPFARLVRDGLITLEEKIHLPSHRLRTREVIVLGAESSQRIQLALDGLSARKKRARHLLEALRDRTADGTQELPLRELLAATGVSLKTAREVLRGAQLALRREPVHSEEDPERPPSLVLNVRQRAALETIEHKIAAGQHGTFLLHGVTGSGKTQVYIEAIRRARSLGKSAIVLVPEISLTPQTVRRFKSHFRERVRVVHSRMTPGERYATWQAASRGECDIVIGPRSAVFAPLGRLGLVVVDEEHESAYKQYDTAPRYHARDVAIVRARAAGAVVILGSATPSLESYANAEAGKYHLLELPERIDTARMPEITIVDMIQERKALYASTKESLPKERHHELRHFRQPLLSALLHERITDRLSRHEGIILLQNRRGYAPFVECLDCGHTEACDNCSVTMTYHAVQRHLRCHYCGQIKPVPLLCPECGSPEIQLRGAGTQRIEEELGREFPGARIARMDLDTTTGRGAHDRILRAFGERKTDILLGTQMVAKGLDYPHVTLVGVISADTQLLLPDFRASERTYQLLTQVAGRAGRSTLKGEVVVQTHQADHPTLLHVVAHDYLGFYREESASRRELAYPPFARLVLVELRGPDAAHVEQAARSLGERLKGTDGWFTVLGPAPAVIARVRNNYRWHTVLKYAREQDPGGTRMQALLRTLEQERTQRTGEIRIAIDVDPVGLL